MICLYFAGTAKRRRNDNGLGKNMFDAAGENSALTPEVVSQYTFPMDQDLSSEDLMLLYKQGDAAAFEVLYTRHKGPVFRYVLRQCGDRQVSEELFQDIWMKLIQGRGQYEVTAKFTTYIYTIARNRVIDYYRKLGHYTFDNDDVDLEEAGARQQDQPDVRLDLQQQAARLLTGIEALPALQREVVILKEEAGMSLQEIATLTGVNTETVKSRLRYAIRKLKQVMQDDR
jgi:RNA polymerase sigma-70 factor (ECF subfamily)